jgi:hypothetical protein
MFLASSGNPKGRYFLPVPVPLASRRSGPLSTPCRRVKLHQLTEQANCIELEQGSFAGWSSMESCGYAWLLPRGLVVDWTRDVNWDPIPTNPWGISLLGYGYGTKIVPMGMDMGQNLHPLGKRVWVWEAIIRTRLPMGISYVYTCRVCMNELRPSRPPSPARQRTRPQVLAQ